MRPWQEGYKRVASRLVLHFDGGSRGNPGPGYGSYVLTRDGQEVHRCRLSLGPRLTNNEAEYRALIAGLADALNWLAGHQLDPARETIEVRGDSQLVIRQLQGTWKAREPRLAALRDRALGLLRRFGRHLLRQVPRRRTLEVLGH